MSDEVEQLKSMPMANDERQKGEQQTVFLGIRRSLVLTTQNV